MSTKSPPTTADPRTGVIYVKIGNQKFSTGTTKRAEARRIISLTSQLGQLIPQFALGKTMTVAEILEEFSQWIEKVSADNTARNQMAYLRLWVANERLANKVPSQITEADVDAFINPRREAIKRTTRQTRLSVIRKFFDYCIIKKYAVHDPSRLIKVNHKLMNHEQREVDQKHVFTPAEYTRLIDWLNKRIAELTLKTETHKGPSGAKEKLHTYTFWRAATAIGRYSGLRMTDIAQLEWAVFRSKPGCMVVWTDKTDARVPIPLSPELTAAIGLIPRIHPQHCFPAQRAIARDPVKKPKLSVQFTRICQMAGIQKHSFHDLRHTYTTDCVERGVPILHIRSVLGHKSSKTTEGYIHTKNEL